jgi:hypothetical protein
MSPSTALAPRLKGAEMRRSGLEIDPDLSFEDWLALGQQLGKVASLTGWRLGDWFFYGQFAYAGKYEQAMDATGLSYQTLANYAWVAGKFELSRRKENLSIGHHALVAGLPPKEQEHWLTLSEAEGLSVTGLREELLASRAVDSGDSSERLPVLSLRPKSSKQAAAWDAAAERAGKSVAEWALETLDEKAGLKLAVTS